MATGGGFVAGAIIGKLMMDKSGWDKSVKAVGKDEKKLGSTADRIGKRFSSMGKKMTLVGGAIVGTLGAMVNSYVKAGDEVHKMALRTGFTTETLSELRYAAQIAGADIGALEKGVKRMSKTIVDASAGMATYQRAFERINVDYNELADLSPEEQFETIAFAIADLEDPTLRAATAQDIFGRAGTQLLPLFAEGAEGLDALRQKAHDMGIVFDQEAANKAAKLADAQTTLKAAMSGLTIMIADHIVPAVTSFVEKVTGIIEGIQKWGKENQALMGVITTVTGGIGSLMLVLGPLLMTFGKLLIILPKIKLAAAALTGPFGLVAGGLALITERIITATKHFKSYSDLIQREADLQGKKVGWLGKTWDSLNSTYRKVFFGIDDVKMAQGALNKKIEEGTVAQGKQHPIFEKGLKLFGDLLVKSKEFTDEQERLGAASKLLGADFEALGLKTKTELQAELVEAEEALVKLKQSSEATPGSIQKLESQISSLKEELYGTTEATTSLKDELGLVMRVDLENKLANMKRALELYKDELAPGETKRLAEEIDNLEEELGILDKTFKTVTINAASLGSAFRGETLPAARDLSGALGGVQTELESVGYKTEEAGKDIEKSMSESATAVSTVWADAMRSIAGEVSGAFMEMTGLAEIFATKSTEFNQDYFDKAISDIDAEYKARKQSIIDNIQDADEQAKALAELAEWKKKEEDRIRADEDKARDEHAKREEKRQKNLWNNIKGIFGTAVEEMLTVWATDFVGALMKGAIDVGKSIFSNVGGALEQTGKAAAAEGMSIGGVIVSLAKAIAKAAKILAGAAKEILIVGGVAVALYAGFKLVGGVIDKLLGKGGGDLDYTNKLLETIAWGQGEKLDLMNDQLHEIKESNWDQGEKLQALLDAMTTQGTVYVNMFASEPIESLMGNLDSGFSGLSQNVMGLGGNFEKGLREFGGNIAGGLKGLGKDISGGMNKIAGSGAQAISAQSEGTWKVTGAEQKFIAHRGEIVDIYRPARSGGSSVNLEINSPLIITQSIGDSDIKRLGEKLYAEIKYQAGRAGREL